MRTLASALVLIFLESVPAFAIDVTSCPLVIPAGETGVVQGDFSCGGGSSANPHHSIFLDRGARLDLNGHTITYDSADTLGLVYCASKCEITNGTLQGAVATDYGIWVKQQGRATVRDVVLSNFFIGMTAPKATVVLENVSIDAAFAGVVVAKQIQVDHVDVTLPGDVGPCLEASNGGKIFGNDVTVTGCDYGIYSQRRIELANATVTNSRIGVFSTGRVTLTGSSVTGSEHYDIYSGWRPVLVNTACDVSQRYNRARFAPDGSWNACPGE